MVREKERIVFNSNKVTYIRLQLPSGEAISAPPLSAILGQAQINSSEFCRVFNEFSSKDYETGVLLNVDLYRKSDNSYYFIIRGISFPYILFQISNANRSIFLEHLYDAFRIKLLSMDKELDFNTAKQLFSSARSIGFNVIL
jgi:ribosomal protein L11